MDTTQTETNPPGHSAIPVRAIRRAEFTVIGRAGNFVAVQVSDFAIEIYRVDALDGIEMFLGYVRDTKIPASVRMCAVEALAREGAR